MYRLLSLASAMTLAMFLAIPSADALLISTVTAPSLSAGCNGNDGGSGNLLLSCKGGAFSAVNVSASGPPLLNAPDITATTLTVTTGPSVNFPVTLDVIINSVGFNFAGGPVTALFQVNNLIGNPQGPFVLSASSPVGTLSHTFHGSGSDTDGPKVLGAFTNDTVEFLLTFDRPFQSVDATIELVGNVPEPASLSVLGMGLLGLGMVSRKKTIS